MIEDYAIQLPKARQCEGDLLGGKKACTSLVPAALAGCGSTCSTYVDDAKKLNELRDKWAKEKCVAPPCASPIVCVPPAGSACTVLVNTCTDVL